MFHGTIYSYQPSWLFETILLLGNDLAIGGQNKKDLSRWIIFIYQIHQNSISIRQSNINKGSRPEKRFYTPATDLYPDLELVNDYGIKRKYHDSTGEK